MARILQITTLALLAWLACSQLNRLSWLLVPLVIIFCGLNALTVWMVRARPKQVASLSRHRIIERYVRFACFFTGDQVPSDATIEGSKKKFQLYSFKQVQVALNRGRQVVRGHDHALEGILSAIHQNHRLRKSRKGGTWKGPLASFLLVGDEGIGKRYLTRVVAKLLYRKSGVEVFDCSSLTSGSLMGNQSGSGALMEAVESDPCSVLLFERVDRASTEVQSILTKLLTTGQLRPPHSEQSVSFVNTVIVLTTTKLSGSLATLDEQPIPANVWRERAMSLVRDESVIAGGLLNAITEMFYLRSPDDRARAEVVALLMKKECSDHAIHLAHIDPVVLATQVMRFDDAEGFALAPQQVQKLLSKPLVAATENKQRALSLRVRRQQRED